MSRDSSYCPYRFKYELVDWVVRYRGFTVSAAQSLTKKQLYAIYHKKEKQDEKRIGINPIKAKARSSLLSVSNISY
jgi:hypothetical protein